MTVLTDTPTNEIKDKRAKNNEPLAKKLAWLLVIAFIVWFAWPEDPPATVATPAQAPIVSATAHDYGNPQTYQLIRNNRFNINTRTRADAWITAEVTSIEDATATAVQAARDLQKKQRVQVMDVAFFQLNSAGEKEANPSVSVSWSPDGNGWTGEDQNKPLTVRANASL